ncbi:MAG: hypothetical protein VYE73_19130 [Acidobacteriota bacterium]|nr:hypothetical protein [Acidobacteriota bacterium]
MEENAKLKPALIGGVTLGVANVIPFLNMLNCACCALIIGGGVLASYLYVKDLPPSPQAPYGDGALIGLMAGVIGAPVTAVLNIPMRLLTSSIGMMPNLDDMFEQMDIPEEVQGLLSGISTGGFSLTVLLFGLMMGLVINSIFATLGGVIGIAIFKKADPSAQ